MQLLKMRMNFVCRCFFLQFHESTVLSIQSRISLSFCELTLNLSFSRVLSVRNVLKCSEFLRSCYMKRFFRSDVNWKEKNLCMNALNCRFFPFSFQFHANYRKQWAHILSRFDLASFWNMEKMVFVSVFHKNVEPTCEKAAEKRWFQWFGKWFFPFFNSEIQS